MVIDSCSSWMTVGFEFHKWRSWINDQMLPNEGRCIKESKEREVTSKEWFLEEREGWRKLCHKISHTVENIIGWWFQQCHTVTWKCQMKLVIKCS